MNPTIRDKVMLSDMALSHVLARDSILSLGYYTSVTRLNTRLRQLIKVGLVKRIETPFFGQGLYCVGPAAADLLEPRIWSLVRHRSDSPRFLRHALMTTFVRVALIAKGATDWRFEQQLWTSFNHGGRELEVRPDGLVRLGDAPCAVEVDMGQVSTSKFAVKLAAYEAFQRSGACAQQWRVDSFRIFVATTCPSRAEALSTIADRFDLDCLCLPFENIGAQTIGAWS